MPADYYGDDSHSPERVGFRHHLKRVRIIQLTFGSNSWNATKPDPAYQLALAFRAFGQSSESRNFLNETNEDGVNIENRLAKDRTLNQVNVNNTVSIVIVDTTRVNLSARFRR